MNLKHTIIIYVLIHICRAQHYTTIVTTNADFPGYKIVYPNETTVTLECNVSSPAVFKTWLHNDREIPANSSRITWNKESKLEISDFNADSDLGEYLCVITNNNEEQQFDFRLIVYPTVKLEDKVNILQGEKLVLHCSVTGYPTPAILWIIGENLVLIGSEDRYVLSEDRGIPNAILTIENTTLSDANIYKCSAANLASSGQHVKTSTKVNVIAKYINATKNNNQAGIIPALQVFIPTASSLLLILVLVTVLCVKYKNKLRGCCKSDPDYEYAIPADVLPFSVSEPIPRRTNNRVPDPLTATATSAESLFSVPGGSNSDPSYLGVLRPYKYDYVECKDFRKNKVNSKKPECSQCIAENDVTANETAEYLTPEPLKYDYIDCKDFRKDLSSGESSRPPDLHPKLEVTTRGQERSRDGAQSYENVVGLRAQPENIEDDTNHYEVVDLPLPSKKNKNKKKT